jgi:hypothetical protein
MRTIQTNIFPITGFGSLAATFAVVALDGLAIDHEEFFENCHGLQKRMNRVCRTGTVVLQRAAGPVLAVPVGSLALLPTTVVLKRTKVTLRVTAERIAVDFSAPSPEMERLAIRFLQSALRDSLETNNALWSPDARNLYFEKKSLEGDNFVGMHRGFGVAVVRLPNGGFGLQVDAQFKFIARRALPARLSAQDFRSRHRLFTFVYHLGDLWYEVKLDNWTNLTVAEYRGSESGGRRPLLELIHERCGQPLPQEVARLDRGGTVLEYENADGETRGVPAQLCFRMYDTNAPEIQRVHRRATRAPEQRHTDVTAIVAEHLSALTFVGQRITVAATPWASPLKSFLPPDLKFGSNVVLSVQHTPGAKHCDLSEYARTRATLLMSSQAGFFTNGSLSQQFLLLPKTIEKTWGPLFAQEFERVTNELWANSEAYAPTVAYYDNFGTHNYADEADAIAAKAAEYGRSGYAVVMLADRKVKSDRREDELAGCTGDRLRDVHVLPAFMHVGSAEAFYYYDEQGRRWAAGVDPRGLRRSYLRLSALNKMMLTARKWPFVLGSSLHAGVTIGIDVRGTTAGFTGVCQYSQKVWTQTTPTKRKERLSYSKCKEMLLLGITKVAKSAGTLPEQIVVQRDGRMFEMELQAARDALEELKQAGIIAPDAKLTCVEIPKSGAAAFRFFDEYFGATGARGYRNPEYGTYTVLGPNEGYVCNTGASFRVPGTVRPLHVKRVSGDMPIEDCLRDIFYLACLTWSKPDGCSRFPVTVRLNDRQLIDVATPYDDEYDEAPVRPAKSGTGGAS